MRLLSSCCSVQLDETNSEIEKIRKNTREAKVQICEELTSLPFKCHRTPLASYWVPAQELKEFVKSNETKIDKVTCLTKIIGLKQQLQRITC